MLAHARRAVGAAGLADRVELLESVLPATWRERAPFDAAVSNSLLHHLHEPMVLWSEIKAITKVGAPILIMDLVRPTTRAAARDIVETYARDERPILKSDFFNSLLAAFTIDEVRAQLRAAQLDRVLTVEMMSDRHLSVFGVCP
jgi:SAM-dependent methyltransferase